jgi:hypothetical protein
MMFSGHLRMFMEVCVMTKTTSAACEGELGDDPIQVKLHDKTVKACSEPRASLRIARRNLLLGAGTAVAAGLAPTASAAGRMTSRKAMPPAGRV